MVLTVALAVVAAALTRAGPRTAALSNLPWWAWVGGLCGAVTLSATTVVAPRLGTGGMIALVLAGEVVCSLVLDQWGMLGVTAQPAGGKRLIAAGLLLAGAALMR